MGQSKVSYYPGRLKEAGLLRFLAGDRFEVYSAGTEATSVRPEAVAAMGEIGVDISNQESKTLGRYSANASTASSPSATKPTRRALLPRRGEPPALVPKRSFAGYRHRRGTPRGV